MKGSRLGGYEILDKLGEGGMGEVWRARDERLNRTVAVKILPAAVSSDPSRRARFEREARVLAALNHPNIVSIYGAGSDDGLFYIVSELVDGESLRAVIDRGRPPVRKVIDIAVQTAEAIAAAHAVGIVHRDLKPENILLTSTERVKVLDFGLAKQKTLATGDRTATMALSEPGLVIGTAGYMSPEQVRGAETDHRTDIFSFGAVLYELVTGRRAFQAPSSVETMHAILHDDPPELESDGAAMPPALGAIVRRCLEKRPEDRFQSAADLSFALRALTPSTGSGSQPRLTSPPASRRRWFWAAAAAFAGVLLLVSGFLIREFSFRRELPSFRRITFRTGLVTNARFTPDGRNVIYSAKWDNGPARVYLAIPGNPDSRDLDFPDGTLLASVSSKEEMALLTGPFGVDGTGTLVRGSVSGGRMRASLDGVFCADWSPDGSALAIVRVVNGKYRLEYLMGKTLLDNLEWPPLAIRMSPDGSRIAFAHFQQGANIGLSVVDLTGKVQFLGIANQQTPNRVDPVLNWTPDGKEILYRSFDPSEWGTLYAMDLKGRRRVVARIPGHLTLYDVARDGRLLLRTDQRQQGILGVAPGETVERELSCLDSSLVSGISEDGNFIVATILGESGGPRGSVYLRKTDGSPPVRLGDGAAWAFSPDGKWVSAYSSTSAGSRRYVLLPTGAGEEREISIPQLKGVNLVLGFASDHQSLFVRGPNRAGRLQNFQFNPLTGVLRPIGPQGVADMETIVSPDRRQLVEVGPDGGWWAYPVDGGPGSPLKGLTSQDIPVGFRADNRSLYICAAQDDGKALSISSLELGTGKRAHWKTIRTARPVEQLSNPVITPDGRAYAFNYLVKTSELYVAEAIR